MDYFIILNVLNKFASRIEFQKKIMWVKQCHKPPMTGNGKNTIYKNGDDWGMAYGIVLSTSVH